MSSGIGHKALARGGNDKSLPLKLWPLVQAGRAQPCLAGPRVRGFDGAKHSRLRPGTVFDLFRGICTRFTQLVFSSCRQLQYTRRLERQQYVHFVYFVVMFCVNLTHVSPCHADKCFPAS